MNTPARAPAEGHAYSQSDAVDLYRHGLGDKHVSGWLGPATLIDVSELSHGLATVKWQGRHLNVRLQDLRPHLALLVVLVANICTVHLSKGRALSLLHDALEHMASTINNSILTLHAKQRPEVFAAASWVARTGCGISRVDAVRMACGAAKLPALSGFQFSLTLWYFSLRRDFVYTIEDPQNAFVNLRHTIGDRFGEARVLQFLTSGDSNDVPFQHNPDREQSIERLAPRAVASEPPRSDPIRSVVDALPPIAEEYSTDIDDDDDADHDIAFDGLVTAEHWLAFDSESTYVCVDEDVLDPSEIVPMRTCPDPDPDIAVTASWFIASALPEADPECVEVSFPYFWSPVLTDIDWQAVAGEVINLRFYLGTPLKKTVSDRDTDDLTKEELITHRDAVTAAIAKELKTWQHYKCFSRRPKQGARNVIDCRWVIKWQFVQNDSGVMERTIRARLTVQGFKDRDAEFLNTYAATSTRWSRRLVCSTAATRNLPLVRVDVEKAFLQGMTYTESSQLTGEL